MERFFMSWARGFRAPFEGVSFVLRHRRLWRYIWIPLAINVVLFGGLAALFVVLYPSLIGLLLPPGNAWYWAILRALLWVAGSMLLGILLVLAFTVVGNIIAGPFNDLLSERVEGMILGISPANGHGFLAQVRLMGQTLIEELKRLSFYVAGSLLLLLLNLAPGVGTLLYVAASAVWTLLFLALEFGDYYLGRHWASFWRRWSIIWAHRWASVGFGAAAGLLLWIPVANLLLIPGAVAGGTLLWTHLSPPHRTPRR